MIADGALDGGSVPGLAARLGVSERHLHRLLVARVGASPVQLARTRRAQVARMLLEETAWPMPDVAFAAGFSSVRQFNDVLRVEYAATPTDLRLARRRPTAPHDGGRGLVLRLRHTRPFDGASLLAHLTARAVPGLESVVGGVVRRLVPGAAGPAVVELDLADAGPVMCLRAAARSDVPHLVARVRHWADLDADPAAVAEVLGSDSLLAQAVAARPGLRVPGTVDPGELVLRTVLGQQVSLKAARTLTERLVVSWGEPGPEGLTSFPEPSVLAGLDLSDLRSIGLTSSRATAVHGVARALAAGLEVGPGCDRATARRELGAVPGVGPWTVEYAALRARADPDAFPAHDLVLRRMLGVQDAREALARAERWRPWRGYAAQHLWTLAAQGGPQPPEGSAAPHPSHSYDDPEDHS